VSGGTAHVLSALKYDVITVDPSNPDVEAVKPTVKMFVALTSNPM